MSAEDEIIDRLDRLITLFRIAFAGPIEILREEITSDPVASSILEVARNDWVASGDLQRKVSGITHVSTRTVLRAIARLTDDGLIVARSTGNLVSYRSSGIL